MATNLTTPGVSIEEVSTLPASIAGVATAVPAFIGYTEKAIIDGQPWDHGTDGIAPPVRITSLLEFEELFGLGKKELFSVNIVDTGSATDFTRSITATLPSPSKYILYQCMEMYFNNGGGPCYIVSVGDFDISVGKALIQEGIESLDTEDEPTLIVFPEATKLTSTPFYGEVVQTSLAHCALMQDRFTISDFYGDPIDSAQQSNFRSAVGADNLSYGATYTPTLETLLNYFIDEDNSNYTYVGNAGIPAGPDSLTNLKTTNPAVYDAVIQHINNNFFLTLPASAAMAGIYARVDRERGVWKSPANVGVRSVTAPSVLITNEQQGPLNVDPTSGKSINVIRAFTGRGIIPWGGRTLAGNDNEWRYINVRRLFLFAEESIQEATEFVVFEPNTAVTWQRVKGMIENFLTSIWRDGALAGATTEQAYFVRVGLGETMTSQDILEGRMIVEVGLAAVRPAEFIVLRFLHKVQES